MSTENIIDFKTGKPISEEEVERRHAMGQAFREARHAEAHALVSSTKVAELQNYLSNLKIDFDSKLSPDDEKWLTLTDDNPDERVRRINESTEKDWELSPSLYTFLLHLLIQEGSVEK